MSVGYEGRTVDELIEILRRHDVSLLIDVRLNAISRRAGFSKRVLGTALNNAGIEYRHAPELGNPKENRAPLRNGDPGATARFRQHLAANDSAVAEVATEASRRVVALLCIEQRHDTCHRSYVADAALEHSPGLTLVVT